MAAVAAFAAPSSIAVAVPSALSRSQVIDRLTDAVDEHRYSSPGRDSPGFFRLGGSVAVDQVTLTARPYVIPGVIAGYGAMTLELRGRVVEREDGSEIRGTVTAPMRWTTLAFAAVAWIIWVALGTSGGGPTWLLWAFVALGSVLIAAAWALIIRRNQRMALRNVDELTRMLRLILGEPSTDRVTLANAD